MNTTKSLLKAVISLILISASFCSVQAITITVNQQGGGDYLTITEGIAAASAGDIVLVYPGIYVEAITINNTITLESWGGPEVTIIENLSTVITVQSGSALSIIIGFTIRGSNTTGVWSPLNGGGTFTMLNCVITENDGRGIWVENHLANIYNCVISDNGYNGIHVYGDGADAIIANCVSHSNNHNGIWVDDGADPSVFNNILYNNQHRGIYVTDGTNGDIIYNDAYNNPLGAYTGFNVSPTNIEVDPMFVNYSDDLHLQWPDSPCIDTGRPEPEYNDPNGTRSDMGIFGSTNCWGEGAPGVTDVQVTPESVPQGETIDINASGTVQ